MRALNNNDPYEYNARASTDPRMLLLSKVTTGITIQHLRYFTVLLNGPSNLKAMVLPPGSLYLSDNYIVSVPPSTTILDSTV